MQLSNREYSFLNENKIGVASQGYASPKITIFLSFILKKIKKNEHTLFKDFTNLSNHFRFVQIFIVFDNIKISIFLTVRTNLF